MEDRIERAEEDAPDLDLDEIINVIVRYFFSVFFVFGYTFTAGSSAVIPMVEKKGGLRHMMHLFGLKPWQYWIGMKVADLIIALFPGIVASLMLILTFGYIMDAEYVW